MSTAIEQTHPTIVYYNDDHSKTTVCITALSESILLNWNLTSTWRGMVTELEAGCDFLVFHVDMLTKSSHITPIEFIDAITTTAKFTEHSRNVKIGVIITPNTPLSTIRTLQKTGVQGLLLDINYYSVDAVRGGLTSLINHVPYWPKHIIDSLPGNVKKLVKSNQIELTARQEQVFQFITERGSSNKAIAKALGISESTVKLHVTEVFKKYGVKSRTQLAAFSNITAA